MKIYTPNQNIKKAVKQILRSSKYLEMVAYMMQNNRMMNPSGYGEYGDTIEDIYNHFVKIATLFEDKYPGDIRNKTILEIGTGITRTAMLYMIKTWDLKKVYCYDRFNCLNKIDDVIIEKYNLSKYLPRIHYISCENNLLINHLRGDTVDYIVSNAVLEHVPDLKQLFGIMTKILDDNGTMYHKVDLRCHNRFKKCGELYFHTFSTRLWNIMGDKIGHPNRKILTDYLEIFEKCKLKSNMKIIQQYDNLTMEEATKYLKVANIEDYKYSIVEFILQKNKHKNYTA